MKRSNCFFVVAFNHVFDDPRWYNVFSPKQIMKIHGKFKKIVGTYVTHDMKGAITTIKLARGYIDKGGGKYRPLGVPSYEWRIVLAM
jgi:hypothetical protein